MRARQAAVLLGVRNDPIAKEKQRQGMIEYWKREPGKRAEFRNRMAVINADPAFKAKLSQLMRERNAEPAEAKRIRKRLGEAMPRNWADPAHRERMSRLGKEQAARERDIRRERFLANKENIFE